MRAREDHDPRVVRADARREAYNWEQQELSRRVQPEGGVQGPPENSKIGTRTEPLPVIPTPGESSASRVEQVQAEPAPSSSVGTGSGQGGEQASMDVGSLEMLVEENHQEDSQASSKHFARS